MGRKIFETSAGGESGGARAALGRGTGGGRGVEALMSFPVVGYERSSRREEFYEAARDYVRPVARAWPREAGRESVAVFCLRLSLASVFFWFGLLKVLGTSPVVGLLKASFPFLAASPYIELLGLSEMLIATGLFVRRLAPYAAALTMLHLLGTLSVVLVAPSLVFAPAFPSLTMEGEFLAKNVVLIAAALAVAYSRE